MIQEENFDEMKSDPTNSVWTVIKVVAQSSGETLSVRIADRIKDSLGLTMNQRNEIFSVNVSLQNQKATLRQTTNSVDSLRIKIQSVENTRDSLYRNILSNQQYLLFKQKKSVLIRSN